MKLNFDETAMHKLINIS